MLSAAKHLCSFSQVLEPKATAEILRFAQDDSRFILSHLQGARARVGTPGVQPKMWVKISSQGDGYNLCYKASGLVLELMAES
jgi:hypothetical protein